LTDIDAGFDKYGRVDVKIGGETILSATDGAIELEYKDGDQDNEIGYIQIKDEDTKLIIESGEIAGRLSGLEDLQENREGLKNFGLVTARAINQVHGEVQDGDSFFIFEDDRLKVNQDLIDDASLVRA